MNGFFVSLGDLFEKHGAAQTGILTNKSVLFVMTFLNYYALLQIISRSVFCYAVIGSKRCAIAS